MSTYKLYYFNGKGRAELARWLFALGEVEYEDIRFEKEKWPEFKPKTPFGQLPCLEVDGEMFSQGNSIARFVAKRTGYAGKGELDECRADMMVDCVEDMLKPLIDIFHIQDETAKAEAKKKYNDEKKPAFFEKFEKFLSNNKNGYLVGDGLTWADMSLVLGLSWVEMVGPIDYTNYPLLKELNNKVTSEPKIAAWIAKRPVTQF